MTDQSTTVTEITALPQHHPLVETTHEFLNRQEVLNSIMLDGLRNWRAGNNPNLRLFAVLKTDQPSLVASISPGFRILLSQANQPEHELPALIDHLLENNIALPGVMARAKEAQHFATVWTDRTNATATPGMHQRMLVCGQILPQPEIPGSARLATDADWDLIARWVADFGQESDNVTPDRLETYVEGIRRHLAGPGGIMLWFAADGTPVSMAGFKAPSDHGWRVGPVYTPPEHRKLGYGQSVTTAITRHLMENGADFVCLYTDAANPTSNHIYEEIGYRWIADIANVHFAPPSS